MKNRLMYLLVFALLLLPAACGGDKELPPQEFSANDITLMVPGGWQATYEASQEQIMLYTPGEEYGLGVQILPTATATAEQFAQAMSTQLDGTTPQPAAKYGDYELTAEIMGLPARVNILTRDGYSLVLVEVGAYNNFAQQADEILKSLKSSKAEFQNVLSALKF